MYHDDRLKELRKNYLKNCRPTELRRLTKAGELDEHLQRMATACRREQARMVESGEAADPQAWQWAIREVLLETARD